jgi:hypothetical protein
MLKVEALRININTTNGRYGLDIPFDKGLNIIRGNNSSGKSTIFQSILYALGMEELIGSRNSKAMQSVLKNEVLNDERIKEAEVLESSILLEISNNTTITIERFIKSETRDSRLVNVYYGPVLTEGAQVKSDSMYVHDPGAAVDIKYGFHAFLESFLGFNLPEVQYNDSVRKLYLQTIFPSFVIEQKLGWSDFLSTIPFYNLRDKERRAIEFILKLDSWNIEEKKQEIKRRKQEIEALWSELYYKVKELARRSACEIEGLEEKPFIINNKNNIFFTYNTQDDAFSLDDYLHILFNEVTHLEENEVPKIEQISKEKEKELKEENERYYSYSAYYKELIDKRNIINANLHSVEKRFKQIGEELIQNQHHLKVKKFGAQHSIAIATGGCPTCGQEVGDSLLPTNSSQIPMSIEDNIGYLQAQKSMTASFIEANKIDLKKIEESISSYEEMISLIRDKIRAIKRDLVSDGRLPSIEILERRIQLKNRFQFYESVKENLTKLIEQIEDVSASWKVIIEEEGKLPKESFSTLDFAKLKKLNTEFIRLLKNFDYGSKSLDDLKISKDKLIPVVEGYYNIKFDSSASDLVRAIVAYTCSLYIVSNSMSGYHPGFFMFDEPGTQETANSSLREMLKELQTYENAQVLIFASFKQSDSDFKETTEGLKFNLIRSKGKKFIRKKSSN